MRKILFFIGRIFSILFPNDAYEKMTHLMEWFYTGYRSKYFKRFGKHSKMGFGMFIRGERLIEVGDNVIFGGGNFILTAHSQAHSPDNTIIVIGDRCVFGLDCHITAAKGIFIGTGLRTGKSVLISDNGHGDSHNKGHLMMMPDDRPLVCKGAIHIGDNVWIGEKAAVLSGVTIGDGAIIGANSIVTHDIPPYSVAVGCPARIIYRCEPEDSIV